MQSAATTFENSIAILLIIISWLSPFVLAVVAIDKLTKKPKQDISQRLWKSAGAIPKLGTTDLRKYPTLSILLFCPGAWIAVIGYLFVIGPWLPAIFTLPRGAGIRPMSWAITAWLICAVITYVGTPLAALDIFRGLFSVRRSRVSRVMGIALGLVGVAAGLYASHLPYEVIQGMAAWRGWVIEE